MKAVPLLGSLVLVGVIIQIILGLQITAGSDSLLGAHMLIGVIGLIIVIALTGVAFRSRSATSSKILMAILTLVVLAQVALGFQILNGSDASIASHEGTAFIILILTLIMGGITMMTAKKQMKQT